MQQLATKPDVRLMTLWPPYRFESPFAGKGYVLLLHSDDPNIPADAQSALADQIFATGCRYACCSGVACSSWDDAIDFAFIATDPNYQPSDERLLMTTWHERESLSEVVWFALNNTSFDDFVAERFLIVLLSPVGGREEEVRAAAAACAG
ncbi:hypothetical protein NA78x_001970 [Anatilimnocola sp. NA78]|uniref:DUF7684 family protein n=1 Tax=Anatilimnocola sp. NA78 TaxID=3415683 RepID=UPI003CE5C015